MVIYVLKPTEISVKFGAKNKTKEFAKALDKTADVVYNYEVG